MLFVACGAALWSLSCLALKIAWLSKGKIKMLFVACGAALWSLSCLALFKMLFTGGVLDRLLFQMQNVIFSSGMHRKSDFAFSIF